MTHEFWSAAAVTALLFGCPKQKEVEPLVIDRNIELPEEDDDLDDLPEAEDTGEINESR